ncbi:TAT-variant-translocated molybdopterin oxidoreductase [Parafilimonas sp.]|uniref:TAT-variant-translocated molybdopterin oxidoreductase n=1 Tax=Parafilimonas sp. TaxID=1969739 RepID=UPI0039E64E25
MEKKYWQNFGELNDSEASKKAAENEFREELPFELSDKLFKAPTQRRDFLKYLGFSTTAAMIAASCELPVRKAVPFANKPEDIVPGVANYYATTYVQDGEAISVLAKVRDGRPIKIEGNNLSPLTNGGTSAKVQASVLGLYDTARLKYPTIDGKEVTLEYIDQAVGTALAGLGGAPVVLLTSTINSPSGLEVIGQFLAKYPGSRHVIYDADSYTGLLLANEASYGKRAIPSYNFAKAKVIVSLGADFLGTWLSPDEFAPQYVTGRKINEKNPVMSKHYQFESILSLTGSNADERYMHKPSESGAVAVALLNALTGEGTANISDAKLKAGIAKAAKDLSASRGAALVVSGSNDPNVQQVVNAINNAIGANGNTIDWSSVNKSKAGIDADFAGLVTDMNAGKVGALVIISSNPAYTWNNAKAFADGLKKVKVAVSLNPKNDETTQLCKYVIPDHHYLESWGDAEPKSGFVSLMQPTINPLFKTRQWQDTLLKWVGAASDYHTYFKNYWLGKLGNETAFDKALQAGVIGNIAASTSVVSAIADTLTAPVKILTGGTAGFNNAGISGALTAISNAPKGGETELVLYKKVGIGIGEGSGNPWLQELPDPVTRSTWDNYVIISPAMAKTLLDIDLTNNGQADAYEVHPAKHVVKVTVKGKDPVSLPILIIPGVHPNTVGIAVGYGRTDKLGKVAEGVGKNVFHLASFNGISVSFEATAVKVEKTGDTYDVAQIQTHDIYVTSTGDRADVMKELTLAAFKKDPEEILNDREHEAKPYGGLDNYEKQGTIYPYYDKPGIHWGMSVDLNSCVGCGACVVACHIENNVPIVGKSEIKRFHDMHWLRIDRYYSGDMENPQVVFQPLMCQHCDNAPCENVCPVSATNHSSEGINQMAYNRCIGTKYCANNCPYKVRRFNWADYNGADSFPDNQNFSGVGKLDPAVHVMNEDLTRMVLNPDVTVRSRGVMEKCSFCVQRCQEGKLTAKKASRPLNTAEYTLDNTPDVQTACQQACATGAIVFGNANDKNSAVSKAREENKLRLFHSLEQLHVLPNVNYLAKVRNREEEVSARHEG